MTGVFAVLALFFLLLSYDDATEKSDQDVPVWPLPAFFWFLFIAMFFGWLAWLCR